VSPKNRPFRVIKGSPREESDPVLPYPATEKELKSSSAFKNLENSFLKPQQVGFLSFHAQDLSKSFFFK